MWWFAHIYFFNIGRSNRHSTLDKDHSSIRLLIHFIFGDSIGYLNWGGYSHGSLLTISKTKFGNGSWADIVTSDCDSGTWGGGTNPCCQRVRYALYSLVWTWQRLPVLWDGYKLYGRNSYGFDRVGRSSRHICCNFFQRNFFFQASK